jgi:hypothetical protein
MRRAVVLAASAVLASGLLAGCDKPVPKVTLQSGATSTNISAQTYCFDATHCRINEGGVTTLHAKAGGTVFVDVPRDVADRHWEAISAQISNGAVHQLKGAELSSGDRHGSHTARLVVPYGQGSSYYVVVYTQSGGKQTGAWLGRIQITS